jgi:hypothetical protein
VSHERYNAVIYTDTIEFKPFSYNATYVTGILLINEYEKKKFVQMRVREFK